MADNKKTQQGQSNVENVGQALTTIEHFFETYKNIITYVLIGIVVIVGGIFLYKKAYIAPMEKEAQEQMFVAEQYFEKDSFNLALNGDGNNWGFLKIIDEYNLTPTANLAHYYAGICYLRLGQYEQAIEQLKKFSSSDKLVKPIALGAIGDAYAELGKLDDAIKYYYKAAKTNKNDFTSPIYLMKAALLCETMNNYKEALEIYQTIKIKYPRSSDARLIDKYISRAEVILKSK